MLQTARILLCLSLGLATLGGCSSYRPPKVDVTNVAVADATGEGVVVQFVLDTTNDNEASLPLKLIEYRLALDGREVFRGVRSPEATLPPKSGQKIRVPAVIRVNPGDPPLTGSRTYTLSGKITYLEPGKIAELLFDSEVSKPEASFSDSGTIQFPPGP